MSDRSLYQINYNYNNDKRWYAYVWAKCKSEAIRILLESINDEVNELSCVYLTDEDEILQEKAK